MSKRSWLVPTLLIVGTVLIVVSIWLPNQNRIFFKTSATDFAIVNEKTGHVTASNAQSPTPVEVNLKTQLHPRDSINTANESEVLIQFKNDSQVRIAQNSEVLLDQQERGSPLLVVKSGEVFVERFGRKPETWIRKDGQSLSVVDYTASDKNNTQFLKESIPVIDANETLTQTEIETILTARKSDFFKCYGQILQKKPQSRGQVMLSFTIEKQGQTSKIEVSKSDIDDNSFKSCLMEVVARTKFRVFTGKPITTVFPLKFE